MRIPGGDLAPARRRRYGGSYGRRRRRRNVRLGLAALLVLAGGAAAYALREDDRQVPRRLTQQSCPTPAPVATATVPAGQPLPSPRQVRLALLNGTPRNGLAKAIGDQLGARGFVVLTQGNAPSALAGPSQVAYGVGAARAATVVSHWVLGSTTVGSTRVPPGTVQVTLGSTFQRLATPAEAAGVAVPSASPTPGPTRSVCAS